MITDETAKTIRYFMNALRKSDESESINHGTHETKQPEGVCKCGHKKEVHNYDFTTECSECSGGQCSKYEDKKVRK